MDRFDRRSDYSFVGEKGLSTEVANRLAKYKQIPSEWVIESFQKAQKAGEIEMNVEGLTLGADDIVVRKTNINQGKGQDNPLKFVTFYKEVMLGGQPRYQAVHMNPDDVSVMMPERNQSTIIRMFCKDESKFDLAKEAFNAFCKEKLGGAMVLDREFSQSASQMALR